MSRSRMGRAATLAGDEVVEEQVAAPGIGDARPAWPASAPGCMASSTGPSLCARAWSVAGAPHDDVLLLPPDDPAAVVYPSAAVSAWPALMAESLEALSSGRRAMRAARGSNLPLLKNELPLAPAAGGDPAPLPIDAIGSTAAAAALSSRRRIIRARRAFSEMPLNELLPTGGDGLGRPLEAPSPSPPTWRTSTAEERAGKSPVARRGAAGSSTSPVPWRVTASSLLRFAARSRKRIFRPRRGSALTASLAGGRLATGGETSGSAPSSA
mmetsp:Transcript_124989/g.358844  ORF Transcript_124989/g.358844 Transcript_124989/m.358844 type:complete len:269 (-) Transcript_124989:1166-1972(-)